MGRVCIEAGAVALMRPMACMYSYGLCIAFDAMVTFSLVLPFLRKAGADILGHRERTSRLP